MVGRSLKLVGSLDQRRNAVDDHVQLSTHLIVETFFKLTATDLHRIRCCFHVLHCCHVLLFDLVKVVLDLSYPLVEVSQIVDILFSYSLLCCHISDRLDSVLNDKLVSCSRALHNLATMALGKDSSFSQIRSSQPAGSVSMDCSSSCDSCEAASPEDKNCDENVLPCAQRLCCFPLGFLQGFNFDLQPAQLLLNLLSLLAKALEFSFHSLQ